MKATEELIIAEHQLEKLNMQPVACLQKQKRRFKNYSWPFLDKELVKQDLDSHAVSKLRRNIIVLSIVICHCSYSVISNCIVYCIVIVFIVVIVIVICNCRKM